MTETKDVLTLLAGPPFKPHDSFRNRDTGMTVRRFRFPNGFGASVAEEVSPAIDLYEMVTVLPDGKFDYDTVERWLTEGGVQTRLAAIAARAKRDG